MKIIKFLMFIFILFAMSCASDLKKGPKWDPAVYLSSTKETIYDAPPEKVFPFFCPVREYEFMREWTSIMRYSKSGYAEKNAVFQSSYPWPFGLKATWVCTRYEPNKAINYTVFIPNTLVFLLENTLEELPDGKTKHTVVYSSYGLNWLGKIIVKKMSSSMIDNSKKSSFQEELVYYLKNNKKISGDK